MTASVCSLSLEPLIMLCSWQPWLILLEGRGIIKSQNMSSFTLFQGQEGNGGGKIGLAYEYSVISLSSLKILQVLLRWLSQPCLPIGIS